MEEKIKFLFMEWTNAHDLYVKLTGSANRDINFSGLNGSRERVRIVMENSFGEDWPLVIARKEAK